MFGSPQAITRFTFSRFTFFLSASAVNSCQESLHHIPTHIRQPKIPPRMPERQPLMIKPQQMQNRRMKIMHMHLILNHPPPILITLPINDPAPHSSSRHPSPPSQKPTPPPPPPPPTHDEKANLGCERPRAPSGNGAPQTPVVHPP